MEDLNERDKSSGLSSLSSAAGSLSGPRGTNVVGTVGASAMRESGQTSSPMGTLVAALVVAATGVAALGRCRSCRRNLAASEREMNGERFQRNPND